MERTCKKKWNMHFTAEHLALLLVLWQQVENEKEAQEEEQSTWSSSRGVPRSTNLKHAFQKLWKLYKNSLKLHTQAERDAENVVHCTHVLCLQLMGACTQEHVPGENIPRSLSNCPIPKCEHDSTMPLHSWEEIIVADERLRMATEAKGGYGVFQPMETKVGFYCYN